MSEDMIHKMPAHRTILVTVAKSIWERTGRSLSFYELDKMEGHQQFIRSLN